MKTYEITEEQIKELPVQLALKWFPKVFETKNGWFKDNCLFNKHWLGFYKGGFLIYGIGADKKWFSLKSKVNSDTERPATESEVLEALKNEAIKRGFGNGIHYINASTLPNYKNICKISNFETLVFNEKLKLLTDGRGGSIFFEGQWAEIIPTYTKEEAEKLLNAKIV